MINSAERPVRVGWAAFARSIVSCHHLLCVYVTLCTVTFQELFKRYRVLAIIALFGLAPLSVKVFFVLARTEVVLPVEPLVGLGAVIVCVQLVGRVRSWKDLVPAHPLDLCVLAHWAWMTMGTMASTMPWVSMKAMLVRTCYLLVFYVGLRRTILSQERTMWWAMRAYALAFVVVVCHVLLRMDGVFTRSAASFAPFPFYNDHTIYAAAAVFILVFLLVDVSRPRPWSTTRVVLLIGAAILSVALVLSFSRAGWICMAAVCCVALLRKFPRTMLFVGAVAALLLTGSTIAYKERWRTLFHGTVDSYSPGAGFGVSLRSMMDIKIDSSNRERLNRWWSAMRMSADRPVLGFGPGTFQFCYHAYQRPEDRTYLTVDTLIPMEAVTRAWSASPNVFVRANPQILFSSGGTAHSEYLLVLAECGWPALILQLAVLVLAFRAGWSKRNEPLVAYALMALVAYAVHGIVNNFLDDPKVAALHFSVLAILSARAAGGRSGSRSHRGQSLPQFVGMVEPQEEKRQREQGRA